MNYSNNNQGKKGDAFEREVFNGGNGGKVTQHMINVISNSKMTQEFATSMPKSWTGKQSGRVDIIAVSNNGKSVEIIEIKDWNRMNDGMTPAKAAFKQAVGGAVAIHSGNGNNPIKGFKNFTHYRITAIARFQGVETVTTHVYTAAQIAAIY